MLTAAVFLNMTKYLINERSYIPLHAGIKALTETEEYVDSKDAKEKLKVTNLTDPSILEVE